MARPFCPRVGGHIVNGIMLMLARRRVVMCGFALIAGCARPLPKSSATYLALGDSYTVGEGLAVEESFPHQMAHRLRWPAPRVVARTGWTSRDLLAAAREVDGTFAHVTLLIGANDAYQRRSVRAYERDLEGLVALAIARAAGDPDRVTMISIPDFSVVPAMRSRSDLASAIAQYNAAAKAIADARRLRWVSIVASSRRMGAAADLVAADGLHPSRAMHAQWVDVIASSIASRSP